MRSASEVAAAVQAGALSAEAAVREALTRAEATQALNAFITLLPEALERARALDARRAAGGTLGPLAGVPVVVKDNFCTAGVRTTAGSKSLANSSHPIAPRWWNGSRLQDAVVIGKTNLDEFGMGSSNENSAFGPDAQPLEP
jgi:aspartyl-tRNA(Asn)/glutamyl-tRNA(Gln) amidotransferase subunit A